MVYTKGQVRQKCKDIAPQYGFDGDLIFAVCLQESGRNEDGSFAPDVARLEQNFYRKYVEIQELATTTEVLLSASYGIMQMMGQSLVEVGYFRWFYNQYKRTYKLTDPLSEICVPKAINRYCINLTWMIEWGCKWMVKKRDLADGDTMKMLGFWNGDTTGKYAQKIINKYNLIKNG